MELLGLIAEQYAVTLDQLARLIGRSYRTARGLRDRWCNAGWTQSAKLAVNLPPFVWLTSRGRRVADSPYRTWQPNHGLATHIEAVTNVRVLLERDLRLGSWECERSLAQTWPTRSDRRPHLPDAVLTCDQRIAVEVELTLKSRARLGTIVEQLSWDYDSVWYFAPERLRAALFEFASTAPSDNVTVHRYPPERADWQRRRLGAHLGLTPSHQPGAPSHRFERRHVPQPRSRRDDRVELATDLPHLADLIAERLDARSRERSRWIGADVVADHLGVDVSYVYEHAAELGARRLGTGPKARLRFRLDLVDDALHARAVSSGDPKSSKPAPRRRAVATPSRGHVPLLPVRRTRSGT